MHHERDLRLDFFRGVALIMIFLDHIPDNFLGHFTLHVFGFSDAAELFIFMSGYVASAHYGRALMQNGLVTSSSQVLYRIWQLYVAHLTLFMMFMAEVAYTLARIHNPLLQQGLNVGSFLTEPYIAIFKAFTLQFQPTFLDILPLYITLMIFIPAALLLLRINSLALLVPSFAVYMISKYTRIEIPAYPEGHHWTFDPFQWQFLFMIGATCGHAVNSGRRLIPRGRTAFIVAMVITLFCAVVRVDWEIHSVWSRFPNLFYTQLWPWVDKSGLGPLRLINFMSWVVVAATLVSPQAKFLSWGWAKRITACGQHSLDVFCLGILLSVGCRMIALEYRPSIPIQIGYCLVGCAILMLQAHMIDWYKIHTHRPPASAGGSA